MLSHPGKFVRNPRRIRHMKMVQQKKNTKKINVKKKNIYICIYIYIYIYMYAEKAIPWKY